MGSLTPKLTGWRARRGPDRQQPNVDQGVCLWAERAFDLARAKSEDTRTRRAIARS